LEEALKESVESTTEKEKVLNEQKKLIEKLTEQVFFIIQRNIFLFMLCLHLI
jgi:hypothetical protein